MSERAAPFHCPYCGESDLRPHAGGDGGGPGAWECRGCSRAFRLRFLGLLAPGTGGGTVPVPAPGGAWDDPPSHRPDTTGAER